MPKRKLNQTFFKASLTFLVLIVCSVVNSSTLQAEDWVFKRSYFTHKLPPEMAATAPMPISPSAYRIPTRPYNTGGTVRWSWRSNRIHLHSGFNHDTQVIWERSLEFRE